jgi:hypothetical protein
LFGSIGAPELLVIVSILAVMAAPVVLLVFALVWAYRRVRGIDSGQEDIRRRLAAIEKSLGKNSNTP